MYHERVNMEKASEMRAMYLADSKLTINELSETYGIPKSSVYRITRMTDEDFAAYKDRSEGNAKRVRKAKDDKTERKTVPIDLLNCPVCKSPITNKGARYCWRCGSDFRSDERKAAEGLVSILGAHYPGFSDEHAEAVRSAIKLLGIDINNM